MRIYKYLTIATISVITGCLAGCSTSSTSAAGMTNDQLKKAVTTQIQSDPRLQSYDIDVDADASKNEVTLSGTVPTEDLRTQAVDLAKGAGNNLQVTDKIDVKEKDIARSDYTADMARKAREDAAKTGEKIGSSIDDAWIHTKIRTKLAGQGELPFGGINVDVVNKVVTLRGTVDSQHDKTEAERIAKDTNGVARVLDQLKVKKG
jgi:hyperosmotically inducible periplasmic protein